MAWTPSPKMISAFVPPAPRASPLSYLGVKVAEMERCHLSPHYHLFINARVSGSQADIGMAGRPEVRTTHLWPETTRGPDANGKGIGAQRTGLDASHAPQSRG